MARTEKQGEYENTTFSDKLADFLQNNRRRIIILGSLIIGVFIAAVAVYMIQERITAADIRVVEDFYNEYLELGFAYSGADEEKSSEYVRGVRDFAEKKSGYPAVRAWMLLAQVHQVREEWPLAEEAWSRAAALRSPSYLTPVCLFNAAAAAEEQGNLVRAIELLKKIDGEHRNDFPGIARNSFSLGRLYEKQEDTQAALEAYRQVVENWPASPWANLANSRIIALTIK
jgi:tetratricopeptide (TPR) repeat protein